MKKYFFIAFVCIQSVGFSPSGLFAQQNANSNGIIPTVSNDEDQGDALLLYRHEREFGLVVHSSGWGFNFRNCKHVTGYTKRTLELEMVGIRSPKEIKIQTSGTGSKPYFYGKQYAVTLLRGGWGYNKVITGKSERKGVEIRLITLTGPVLGLGKPVYLEIEYPPDMFSSRPIFDSRIERYDPTNPMHTQTHILGRAPYFTGFGEMNFFPGAFAKVALSFEHATLDDDVKLLETGVVIDGFYRPIPIMANAQNRQIYINVYLNIMFGKKWF